MERDSRLVLVFKEQSAAGNPDVAPLKIHLSAVEEGRPDGEEFIG